MSDFGQTAKNQDVQEHANSLYAELYERAAAMQAEARETGKTFGIVLGEHHTEKGSMVVDHMVMNIGQRLGVGDLLVEFDQENLDKSVRLKDSPIASDFPNLYQIVPDELDKQRFNVVTADPHLSATSDREQGPLYFEQREQAIRDVISERSEDFIGVYGANHIANIQGYTDEEVAQAGGDLSDTPKESPYPDKVILYVNAASRNEGEMNAYRENLSNPDRQDEARVQLGDMKYASDENNAFQAVIEVDDYSPVSAKEIADQAEKNYHGNTRDIDVEQEAGPSEQSSEVKEDASAYTPSANDVSLLPQSFGSAAETYDPVAGGEGGIKSDLNLVSSFNMAHDNVTPAADIGPASNDADYGNTYQNTNQYGLG